MWLEVCSVAKKRSDSLNFYNMCMLCSDSAKVNRKSHFNHDVL